MNSDQLNARLSEREQLKKILDTIFETNASLTFLVARRNFVNKLRSKYGSVQVEDCALFHLLVHSSERRASKIFDFDAEDSIADFIRGFFEKLHRVDQIAE